jgi:hypothetical protein
MSQRLEMVSNIQPKKIGLNVRHHGPQPSSFVRTFSPITKEVRRRPHHQSLHTIGPFNLANN